MHICYTIPNQIPMLSNYLNFQFYVKERPIKGFCMKIHDDFHETYAVVIDGYHSFCIWLDASTSTWCFSKYTNIDRGILDQIIQNLSGTEEQQAEPC
jgi:hypothetical protein